MKKITFIILTLHFISCTNHPWESCGSSEWKIDIIEPACVKTLEAYPILDSLDLTGAIDWHGSGPGPYLDADLWNLYDAVLIDSMIIYDSITILCRDSGRYRACNPNWFVYTIVDSSFEDNFIDQEGSHVYNANWKVFLNKPVAKN